MSHELSKVTVGVRSGVSRSVAQIVVGANIKGGGGKSVTCQIIATSLLSMGYRVKLVDLDTQKTTIRFWNRRQDYIASQLIDLYERLEAANDIKRSIIQKQIDKYEQMAGLAAEGLDSTVEGWGDRFKEIVAKDCEKYDYIVVDTAGHFDDINVQEYVFKVADLVVVPTKTTLPDLEQMENNAALVRKVRKNCRRNFKAVSVVLLKDSSKNAYNDYSTLNDVESGEISGTLPVLSLDGDDAVLYLKAIGNKANALGLTAVEYGSDLEERLNITRFGCAIINELNNKQ